MDGRILDFIKMSNQAQGNVTPRTSSAPEVTDDLLKTVAKRAPRTSGVIGYIPYVGDVADIGLGAYNMTHGHPFIGAGQIGLGGVGLATGGLGSKVIKGLANAGLKKAQRDIVARGMRKIANNPYRYQVAPSIGLETLALMMEDNKKDVKEEKSTNKNDLPFTVLSDDELNVDLKPIPKIETPLPKVIDEPLTGYVATQDTTQQHQPQVQDDSIARALIEMYNRQYNEMQRPQMEALQRYQRKLPWANISDALIRAGMAGYARALDNPKLADVYKGSEYTNRLAKNYEIDQALAQVPLNTFNATNTLAGNVAVARQMGMDPAVAMADKDIQKVLTAYNTMSGRENVANINAQARLLDSYLDNETQRAIAQGKIDVALQIQNLKNNASTRNALINASGFGATPADVQAMLSMYGYTPTGLTSQGLLEGQQTNVDPVVVGSYLDRMNRR